MSGHHDLLNGPERPEMIVHQPAPASPYRATVQAAREAMQASALAIASYLLTSQAAPVAPTRSAFTVAPHLPIAKAAPEANCWSN
jgi:hypothetical protein